MNISLIVLIVGIAGIILGLLHCFFGYKLGRFLLPVCGLVFIEGILYVFVYDLLRLDTMSTWLFFVGGGIAIYLLLFFFKRFSGFFTGVAGAGMVLLYAIYALNLNQIPLIHPVFFTLCLVAGLLTFVYERVGVVVFTSIFGAGLASFCGLFLYIMGVGSGVASYSNLLVPIEYFLITNIYLVGGATLVLLAAGLFVQLKWTAHRALLSSDRDGTSIYEHRRNNVADSL